MAQRNERLLIDRPPAGDGSAQIDEVLGCDWETFAVMDVSDGGYQGVLDGLALRVFKWRDGLREKIAEYPPGGWHGISRAREHR